MPLFPLDFLSHHNKNVPIIAGHDIKILFRAHVTCGILVTLVGRFESYLACHSWLTFDRFPILAHPCLLHESACCGVFQHESALLHRILKIQWCTQARQVKERDETCEGNLQYTGTDKITCWLEI